MCTGDETQRRVEAITAKLEAGVDLDVDDIKFLLHHSPSNLDYPGMSDYGDLEPYREAIHGAIARSTGHAAYVSILREFESAGVIDELRPDLVDPALDPDGFEWQDWCNAYNLPSIPVGEDGSDYVGHLRAPPKQPVTPTLLRRSIREYLFCAGRGFHFDAEMFYDQEADYRRLLRSVVACTAGLDEDHLTVESETQGNDTVVHVRVSLTGRTYRREFEAPTDYLRDQALDPLREALQREASETIYCVGGNEAWLLVLERDHEELVMGYL